jgi:hypothetical protein
MTYLIEQIDPPSCAWCAEGLYSDAYQIDGEDIVCKECTLLARAVNDHHGVLTISAFTYIAEADQSYHALRTGMRHFVLDPPLILRLTIDREDGSRWIHGTEADPEEAHLGILDREGEPGAGWDGIDEVISDATHYLGQTYCDAEWELAQLSPEDLERVRAWLAWEKRADPGTPQPFPDDAEYLEEKSWYLSDMERFRPRLREVDVPATNEGESI